MGLFKKWFGSNDFIEEKVSEAEKAVVRLNKGFKLMDSLKSVEKQVYKGNYVGAIKGYSKALDQAVDLEHAGVCYTITKGLAVVGRKMSEKAGHYTLQIARKHGDQAMLKMLETGLLGKTDLVTKTQDLYPKHTQYNNRFNMN